MELRISIQDRDCVESLNDNVLANHTVKKKYVSRHSSIMENVPLLCILVIALIVIFITRYVQDKKIGYSKNIGGPSFWTRKFIINRNLTIKQKAG